MSKFTYPADYGSVAMGGHCGVLAVAIFAGRTFEEAWEALKPKVWKKRQPWSGATYHHQRINVLRDWGVAFTSTIHATRSDMQALRHFRRGGTAGYLPRCNLRTFARKHAKPGVTYMLRVSRHVVTLRDGIVIDQGAACPVEQHREAKRIVTHSIASEAPA